MYAGASGDFNPMHTDEVAAKEAGLPSVFGHGMFTAGILAKALTDYVGVGNLTQLQGPLHEADVAGRDRSPRTSRWQSKYEEDGEHRVDLECRVTNEAGEDKVSGVAVASLPARG